MSGITIRRLVQGFVTVVVVTIILFWSLNLSGQGQVNTCSSPGRKPVKFRETRGGEDGEKPVRSMDPLI